MIDFVVRIKRRKKNGRRRDEFIDVGESAMVQMPLTLQDFLRTLPSVYPRRFHEVAYLGRLDPYNATPIIATRLENVIADLQELLLLLEDRSLGLDIPRTVSADYRNETWEFGREGFVRWATDLLKLAEHARSFGENGTLYAMGD